MHAASLGEADAQSEGVGSPVPLREYDVVVVGASCAGLFAAEQLASGGRRVLVVERKQGVGGPARTWIVTDRIREFLGDLPAEVVVHRTGTMAVVSGQESGTVVLDPPDLILERSHLLTHLKKRAERAGAVIRNGITFSGVRSEGSRLGVRFSHRSGEGEHVVICTHLIGADGVSSAVAAAVGASPPCTVPIVQARVRLPAGHDPDRTIVWFERRRTRFFYWLIPESKTHGVLGLVPESPATARDDLIGFMKQMDISPVEYQGAMIPLHSPFRRVEYKVGNGRVLLVGDAAAHVKVTTVGGVVSGVWGALAAVRSIERGSSYRKELKGLHRELYIHDLIRWSLDRFDQPMYDRLLAALNPELCRVLSSRNRDSIAGAIAPLLVAQPRILKLGFQALVRPFLGQTPVARRDPFRRLQSEVSQAGD